MNKSLKEIPEKILQFLKQKNINLNQIQLIYHNKEEFDFDIYQHYYLFVLESTVKSHRKLIIVRNTINHYNDYASSINSVENIEMEKRKLIVVR